MKITTITIRFSLLQLVSRILSPSIVNQNALSAVLRVFWLSSLVSTQLDIERRRRFSCYNRICHDVGGRACGGVSVLVRDQRMQREKTCH